MDSLTRLADYQASGSSEVVMGSVLGVDGGKGDL